MEIGFVGGVKRANRPAGTPGGSRRRRLRAIRRRSGAERANRPEAPCAGSTWGRRKRSRGGRTSGACAERGGWVGRLVRLEAHTIAVSSNQLSRDPATVVPPSRQRLATIDAARGVAIVAMVVFHVAWDLYYLGFIDTDVTTEPFWVLFQRGIVSTFLFLVGVGLVLAHRDGLRWRSFWRRFAILVGAALLTTAGTYFVFPEYFVYFGVLHAIALFSLMGLLFVRAPLWVVAVAIVAVMVPPALFQHPVMTEKFWSWIGFWPAPPLTTDIVPIFPWFGLVLIGIFATRVLMGSRVWARISAARLDGVFGRALKFMGRWSLVIYLVHQPLIYGALQLIPRAAPPDTIGFVRQCETTCGVARQARHEEVVGFCARYCGCALEQVVAQNLWDEVANDPGGQSVRDMTLLCEAMAK
jgi:uncharacterized membrane protein